MTLGRYALVVSMTVLVSLGLALPTWLSRLDRGAQLATVAGGGLAVLNTTLAYGLVLWSKGRSSSVFLGTVLGGMVARMALLLAAVVAGILFLGLPKVPLAISLLTYFVLFLVFELAQLHKQTTPSARLS